MSSFPFLPDHNDLIQTRYEKVNALREAGINPYPARFDAKDVAEDIIKRGDELLESEEQVTVMGRVLVIRSFGKAAFFHVQDRSGKIQVYVKKGVTTDSGFEVYKKFLDGGDLVGVTGKLFKTKTGELTIEAADLVLCSKAVRQLPEKWHGMKDVELRYRQRYVDLIANPEVAEVFRSRSKIVSAMRRFLDDSGFMEVETPMMQAIYGGASARPFETYHNTLEMPLYMRIAPELFLKRLVVGGLDRIYEINRNFRNEGISTQHNPEFTMLELYAGGWNCSLMIDFVEEILRETTKLAFGTTKITVGEDEEIDLADPMPRLKMLDCVCEKVGAELDWKMTRDEVASKVDHHIPEEITAGDEAIVHLFEELCEDDLVRPTFIIEFPKSVSPLSKSVEGRPEVADRFELYANRMEMANGYSELNDPREQYERFADQVKRHGGGDLEAAAEVDEDYVRALEYGMVPTAGLGIGIDRLVMMLTRSASIRDVIPFPLMRTVKKTEATVEAEEGAEGKE